MHTILPPKVIFPFSLLSLAVFKLKIEKKTKKTKNKKTFSYSTIVGAYYTGLYWPFIFRLSTPQAKAKAKKIKQKQ